MANSTDGEVTILKGSKITVVVEEALIDVLVVSFHYGAKIFQGALLDVTKKNIPFGITPDKPWDASLSSTATSEEKTQTLEDVVGDNGDKFHALKQRHTYFQETNCDHETACGKPWQKSRKPVGRNSRDQNVRMRRLRPRQVLCSHCRAICNENSENVQIANTTNKKDTGGIVTRVTGVPIMKREPDAVPATNPTRTLPNANTNNSDVKRPKTSVWTEELPTPGQDVYGSVAEDVRQDDAQLPKAAAVPAASVQVESQLPGSEYQAVTSSQPATNRMILRKRKPSDATEELPKCPKAADPLVPSVAGTGNKALALKSVVTKTSPVIKISFANPQGKGTVVKIPAKLQSAGNSDTEEDSRECGDNKATKDASAKAAKKALKKAKKEAQRKTTGVALSPRSNGDLMPRHKPKHHKHKLKRKRKHKDVMQDEKNDLENSPNYTIQNSSSNNSVCSNTVCSNVNNSGNSNSSSNSSGNSSISSGTSSNKSELSCLIASSVLDNDGDFVDSGPPDLCGPAFESENLPGADAIMGDVLYDESKSKSLRQKLSISLKRMGSKAYMRCSPKYVNDDSNVSSGSGSASGSECGDVPEFPKLDPMRDLDKVKPLMMRISTRNVKKCLLESSREMTVGDIVWGKIHGFPWWPGKVLSLTVSQRDNGVTINQQAHVAWFGSATSSHMPCNQLTPFLDDFKMRYNKKKRGPYKEAIRQATMEAQQVYHQELSPEVGVVT